MKKTILLACCLLALAACGDREAEQRAAIAAQAAAREEAAVAVAREYDSAVADLVAYLAWMAEPRGAAAEFYRLDLTHRFVAYWNAFEALVDAICMLKPVVKPHRQEQVDQLRQFLAERGAGIGLGDIDEAYWRFVETGFVGRATYALGVCFGAQAPAIIEHCFHRLPERERLANFRNALCRGGVDVEILKERVRIEGKQARLSFIVFGMLARLVPVTHRQ